MAKRPTIEVNAGTGGKVKSLTVVGELTGGLKNTGSRPAPSSVPTGGEYDITVNGPSGELQADDTVVAGRLTDGMCNNYTEAEPKSSREDEDYYKMDADPRGLCYIFNNKKFEGKPSRLGADKDRDDLESLFEKLKFTVKKFDDRGADVMEVEIKKLSELSHEAYDCVIIIFLTHGKDGAVQGSDNDWLYIKTITSFFKGGINQTLSNKPKLFFFQSCRGKIYQKGAKVEGDGNEAAMSGTEVEKLVAPEADFFFGYPTVPGYKALRNVESGSWYIQEMVRVFKDDADKDDLLSLMTKVNSGVNEHKSECEDGSFIQQTAEISSCLTKKLYF